MIYLILKVNIYSIFNASVDWRCNRLPRDFVDIDETYKAWVLKSASKKWKDFKVGLKRNYFDHNLSRRQNISNGCANRIPTPQWVWLVNHWKSDESQVGSRCHIV
jgi:hypothetical protein